MPCYRVLTADGTVATICGNLGPKCGLCPGFGDFLCDAPVGGGKTCDRKLCARHRHEVAPGMDLCPEHFRAWALDREAVGLPRVPLTATPVQHRLDF